MDQAVDNYCMYPLIILIKQVVNFVLKKGFGPSPLLEILPRLVVVTPPSYAMMERLMQLRPRPQHRTLLS